MRAGGQRQPFRLRMPLRARARFAGRVCTSRIHEPNSRAELTRRSPRLGRALLLNASHEPLCVVPMRRAVVLVLKEKAEIVARNGAMIRSERDSLPVPSV